METEPGPTTQAHHSGSSSLFTLTILRGGAASYYGYCFRVKTSAGGALSFWFAAQRPPSLANCTLSDSRIELVGRSRARETRRSWAETCTPFLGFAPFASGAVFGVLTLRWVAARPSPLSTTNR